MKILVVDDDPMFTELMVAELAAIGLYNVDVAHSGFDALERALTESPGYDCFLLDIEMPGMDGVELCDRFKSNPVTQAAPIIMVSASAALGHVDDAFSKGATDYLNKPLHRRELLGRMRMVETLARRQAEQNSAQGTPAIDVGDPVNLSDASSCIDYLAMQNYVLKLGSLRMYNLIALGLHISNLPDVFAGREPVARKDALVDVAEIIVECLTGVEIMMSYAGHGDFVILLPRVPGYDPETFTYQMNCELDMLAEWCRNASEIAPVVRVGNPIYRNLLSFKSPDDILRAAMDDARAAKQCLGRPSAAETNFRAVAE